MFYITHNINEIHNNYFFEIKIYRPKQKPKNITFGYLERIQLYFIIDIGL